METRSHKSFRRFFFGCCLRGWRCSGCWSCCCGYCGFRFGGCCILFPITTLHTTLSIDYVVQRNPRSFGNGPGTIQYWLPLLYWPGLIHVITEVAQWEQNFAHGGWQKITQRCQVYRASPPSRGDRTGLCVQYSRKLFLVLLAFIVSERQDTTASRADRLMRIFILHRS